MSIIRLKSGKIVFNPPKVSVNKTEILGIMSIVALSFGLLASSWRKWLDPQIDYGRELYIPWRMFTGGKLFKDVDDLYGPLSRFVQLGLFKTFGPGMMVLAWANIAVYCVTLGLIYYLFRKGWGIKAALLCTFIFVGVFSFSQLVLTSNYNFITPYAQQVTHGFLVSLILLVIAPRWIEQVSVKRSLCVGLCLGLALVLKPEFILANGIIIAGAFYFRIRKVGFPRLNELAAGASGVLLPTLSLAGYFVTYLPLNKALISASFAWINGLLIWKDEFTAHLLNNFSGMDQPRLHLISHVSATLWALAIFGSLVFASLGVSIAVRAIKPKQYSTEPRISDVMPYFLMGLVMGALVWISLNKIIWNEIGSSLLGLLLIYSANKVWGGIRAGKSAQVTQKGALKALITLLALALMTRMLLNGRIYQYGFIQALLATLVIAAVLVEEVPEWLSKVKVLNNYGVQCFKVGIVVYCVMGVAILMTQSQRLYQAKTLAVSEGSDLFYTFTPQVNGLGALINNFSQALSKRPKDETVLVLPEGIMLNYLTKKKSNVSDLTLYTNKEVEGKIVVNLEKNRPDWIVVLSRDLTEYGVTRYGSKGQSGEQIISWMKDKYKVSASQGGDPLDAKQVGGIIYGSIKTVIK